MGFYFQKTKYGKSKKTGHRKRQENFDQSNIENVIKAAFQNWIRSSYRERRSKFVEYYYDTKIEAGSGHVDMLPFLKDLAKNWHTNLDYMYGHNRNDYVLIIIHFKYGPIEDHADTIGRNIARSFSRVKNTKGRVDILAASEMNSWSF